MSIPTIILAKERPDQLRDMLNSMNGKIADEDIIIIDNGSRESRMHDFLYSIGGRFRIVKKSQDEGFLALNSGLERIDVEYFAITDPDILFNQGLPDFWDEMMIEAMIHARAPKIGFALRTDLLPSNDYGNQIRACEKYAVVEPIKLRGIEDEAWYAYLDTTFAIYRKDTYRYWMGKRPVFGGELISPTGHVSQDNYNTQYHVHPVRVGGRFAAVHTGWTMPFDYKEDYAWYKNNCNIALASTTGILKSRGL